MLLPLLLDVQDAEDMGWESRLQLQLLSGGASDPRQDLAESVAAWGLGQRTGLAMVWTGSTSIAAAASFPNL